MKMQKHFRWILAVLGVFTLIAWQGVGIVAYADLPVVHDWTAEGDQLDAGFGAYVATAGDVNGDSYADAIVGAWAYDNGETDEGRVYVYYGGATGLSATPAWTEDGDQAGARFAVVGTAGDVNGDDYDDIIVGAPYYDNGQGDEGRVFVYYGSASGFSATSFWTYGGSHFSAAFGGAVGTAGDVNGDGYDDIIVGEEHYNGGGFDAGRAYVYHGSASGLSIMPDWTVESSQAEAWLGDAVGTAGDVNGDGYSDVIVGAQGCDGEYVNEGCSSVYYGSPTGLGATPAWTANGNQSQARFGSSVGTAGDVNGDGYDDIIVAANRYDNGQTDEGGVFVYFGSVSGLSITPDWTIESDQPGASLGASVGTAGDINGDGYSDVIVGAINYDHGQIDEGQARVYYGSATGLSSSPDWTIESDQDGATLGNWVGTAGDVNGDGYADIIVGAGSYDNGHTNEGSAFAYYSISNQPPIVDAGGPYTGVEGTAIPLSYATASDPDGDALTFAWSSDSALCAFSDPGILTPTLTCADNGSYIVTLTVSDEFNDPVSNDATVTINNVAPTLDAGPNQTVFRNDVVTVSGTWTDPAGSFDNPYAWSWDLDEDGIPDDAGSAPFGEPIVATTSFPLEGSYTLTFAVTDKDGDSGSDSLVVEVLNQPPVCSAATPSIDTLWPPNHKFVSVEVLGVIDPEGDAIAITIDSIFQDEPVDSTGDGSFAPDGTGIGISIAQIRAERDGGSNGRVYHIYFTADDGHGGSCTGELLVNVPKSKKETAVDDGPLFDSTED